jgi:hypothetical protein
MLTPLVSKVWGGSVGADFRSRATCPSAIGIFYEIFALDLGTKCRFGFRHGGLLSVCRIDGNGPH